MKNKGTITTKFKIRIKTLGKADEKMRQEMSTQTQGIGNILGPDLVGLQLVGSLHY